MIQLFNYFCSNTSSCLSKLLYLLFLDHVMEKKKPASGTPNRNDVMTYSAIEDPDQPSASKHSDQGLQTSLTSTIMY